MLSSPWHASGIEACSTAVRRCVPRAQSWDSRRLASEGFCRFDDAPQMEALRPTRIAVAYLGHASPSIQSDCRANGT